MSDVLSADEVLRLDIDFDPDGDWAKAEASWAALARSHEQLREANENLRYANGVIYDGEEAALARVAELEATVKLGDDAVISLSKGVNLLAAQKEAAARAGGSAADALRPFMDGMKSNAGMRRDGDAWIEITVLESDLARARDALAAYEKDTA